MMVYFSRQFTNENELWNAIQDAVQNFHFPMGVGQNKWLTKSLMNYLQNIGIFHINIVFWTVAIAMMLPPPQKKVHFFYIL